MDNAIDQISDEQIALKVQSGNKEVYSQIVQRYEKRFLRYGRKFFSNNDDITDSIQNIFIKSYININSFDASRKFSSWIYRIAHNEFVNYLKKKNKRILPIFDLDIIFPHLAVDKNNNIESDLDKKYIAQELEKFIDKLDIKYKEPLVLYYIEDFDYKEISDIMKIPISTVGIRIKRAKNLLKNNIENAK